MAPNRTADVIEKLLEPWGLSLLGSLTPEAVDKVPVLGDGRPTGVLLLIGNGGSSFWAVFRNSREYRDKESNPLDRWSRRAGQQLARQLGGMALLPFDGPPYLPFQSWAKKTGQVVPSRVSMVLHERFGLWHAYRFALALPVMTNQSASDKEFKSPCIDCRDQLCLKACPVEAFSDIGFGADQCVDYLFRNPDSACRNLGCKARRFCPAGKVFTYRPEHARFHMDAFVHSQRE